MIRLVLLLLLVPGMLQAQNQLSPQAEISVITLGPSQQQLYTAFGHSAFRVYDPVLGIDDAYNYGVFDFDQPNFYLNFARGNLLYRLHVSNYKEFEYVYIYFNRYVHEQKLNLTPRQKQQLYDFLQWNALPENQFYLYDYFYNNCATKMPAVLIEVFGDTVQFDGSYVKTDYTIRELTDLYLKHQPWGDLGIDICLGLPMDKQAEPFEYMFLPDYVESGFAHATILKNGMREPLVKERTVIYESRPQEIPEPAITPIAVFTTLFLIIVVVTFFDFRRKKASTYLDVILFTTLGLLGVLLLLLWVATDHRAAAKNLNLLWALPTHLFAAIAFIRRPAWLSRYFLAVALISLVILFSWPWLPQKLHFALIPLVMAIALRSYTQFFFAQKKRVASQGEPVQEQAGDQR